MAKRRGAAIAVCPRHPGSHVVSKGHRTTKSGPRQDFRCSPSIGQAHSFSVAVAATGPVPLWSPPPRCPEHPKGHVVRDGAYASTPERPRQRYRCYPDPADRSVRHCFTPPLPRDHIHAGEESCEACEELRGTHRGDPTVSRRHSWSVRLVADALRDLARGSTYAEVSKRARTTTGRTRTRVGSKGDDGSGRNYWHTAADWVEAFSPVLWDHIDTRLRRAVAPRLLERDRLAAAGLANSLPVVVVIDEQPVFAKAKSEAGRRMGRPDWSVLVVAELHWRHHGDEIRRDTRLRLVRAMPTADHLAWRLVFDELGYTPDFVIADGGEAQLKAMKAIGTTFIPSLFHVRSNVTEALYETPGTSTKVTATASRELRPELDDHLALLSRQVVQAMGSADWSKWWDDLEAILVSLGAPLDKVRKRRQRSEPAVANVLSVLAQNPHLPLSTGGIEVAIRRRIEPLLDGRAHAFANLERTNRLFDLVVCDDHGLFNKMSPVIDLLRSDGNDNHGWATPLRDVTDPQPPTAGRFSGRYSSLRDAVLVREVARSKGIR